jgi:tight adherence protein B
MLQSVVVALVIFFAIFALLMAVLPKIMGGKEGERTQNALRQIMEQTHAIQQETARGSVLKSDIEQSGALRIMTKMPGGYVLASQILKAGLGPRAVEVLLGMFLLLLLLFLAAQRMNAGLAGYLMAMLLTYLLPMKYLERKINKRNEQFINMFPDVLDMIVRSVRSGFPLNAAIQMVAENMDPPVSTEFRTVAQEVALGRSLDDALSSMAERIDEPDVNFFVVVLNVQQETGGNLAEVIGNLSNIIRKRKQLRLKIKALTSEGRATGWVLGSLPVVLSGVIYVVSPNHLTPLFDSTEGNIVLMTAVGLLGLTFWIIRQMLDIDI